MNEQLLESLLAEFTGMFFRGQKANYVAETTHKDKLYFATDTHELLVNGISYGGGGISQIELQGTKLVITMTDTTKKEVELADLLKYQSALADDIATVEKLGGIPAGTTVGDLKKKTISQVLDDLIFPTVYPTFQAPTASLSLKSTSTTPTLQEIGTTGASVPTTASFNTGFNQGKIMIAGIEKQKRAGALKPSESFIYINGSVSNKTFPTEIPNGSITYKYRAAYEAGPQPLDSKGNNYQTPLPAGTVDSAAVTVTGVYPYFTNKANVTTFAKLPLTTSTTLQDLLFVAEGPNKHAFKLPATYTVTKVEMLNTLSGKYEDFGVSKWTRTTENIEVQSKQVEYAVYTRNDSGFNGEATFKIIFTKS